MATIARPFSSARPPPTMKYATDIGDRTHPHPCQTRRRQFFELHPATTYEKERYCQYRKNDVHRSVPHQTFGAETVRESLSRGDQCNAQHPSQQNQTEVLHRYFASQSRDCFDENRNKNSGNVKREATNPKSALRRREKIAPTKKSLCNHKRVVKFSSKIAVKNIRSHRDISLRTKYLLWNSKSELINNAIRNKIEFRAEGKNWRMAMEEDEMWRNKENGELVHPIHIPPHVLQYYHQQYVYCRR